MARHRNEDHAGEDVQVSPKPYREQRCCAALNPTAATLPIDSERVTKRQRSGGLKRCRSRGSHPPPPPDNDHNFSCFHSLGRASSSYRSEHLPHTGRLHLCHFHRDRVSFPVCLGPSAVFNCAGLCGLRRGGHSIFPGASRFKRSRFQQTTKRAGIGLCFSHFRVRCTPGCAISKGVRGTSIPLPHLFRAPT